MEKPHFFRKSHEIGGFRGFLIFILTLLGVVTLLSGDFFFVPYLIIIAIIAFTRPIRYILDLDAYSNFKQKEKERKEQIKREKQRKEQERKKFEKVKEEKEKQGLRYFEGKWVTESEFKRLKSIKTGLNNNFQSLSSYEFEKFIAKLFRAMGYKTRVTQASNDYGIDVVAEKGHEKIAIQCKKYQAGNPVGNRDVQRLLGSMHQKDVKATHSILITTSHFTVQAREQAKECAIELWDKEDLHKIVKKYLMKI